jgi:hypothetical protein
MQYLLKVRQAERSVRLVVNARLFRYPAQAAAYYQEQVAPLVEAMQGRPEFDGILHPAALLRDLPMVVSVFPIDGELPSLTRATDLRSMTPVIESAYQAATQDPFTVNSMRIELAHYGRFKRCVLRYWLDGQNRETGEPQSRLVYGKVDGVGSNQQALAITDTLQAIGQAHRKQPLFRVPRIYATLPELSMILMEAIPGEASFSRILKGRVRGEGTARLDEPLLEDAIATAAQVAAALHAADIALGEKRTLADEVRNLQTEVTRIQRVLPEAGDILNARLHEIAAWAGAHPALPLRFSHGDFTYTQFIYHQGETGLVDFDNVCQAEPALDLGQFLAYLRFNIRKEERPDQPFPPAATDQLCSVFVNTYLETSQGWLEDESVLRTRMIVYELLSIIRLGIHSWQKLKGSRFSHAIALLEERMPCLTQAN